MVEKKPLTLSDLEAIRDDAKEQMTLLGEALEANENDIAFAKKVAQTLEEAKSDTPMVAIAAKRDLEDLGIPESVNRAVIDQKLIDLEREHKQLLEQYETNKSYYREMLDIIDQNPRLAPAVPMTRKERVWEGTKRVLSWLWEAFVWLISFIFNAIIRILLLIISTPLLIFNLLAFFIGGCIITTIVFAFYSVLIDKSFAFDANLIGNVASWIALILTGLQILNILFGEDPTSMMD